MADFRPIIVTLLLSGLFAFALISAGYLIAVNNGASQTIVDDPTLSSFKTDLEANLADANNDANATQAALSESPITINDAGLNVDAVGGIWKTMKTIPIAVYNLIAGLVSSKLLGSPQLVIVLTIIASILTITVVFAVWKFLKIGEGG